MKLTLLTLLAGTAISNGAVLLNFAGGSATLTDGSTVTYTVTTTAGTLTGDAATGLFDSNNGASYTIAFNAAVTLQVSATTGDNLGNSGDNDGVLFSSVGTAFVGTGLNPTDSFVADPVTGDILFTRPNGAANSGSSVPFGDLTTLSTTEVTITTSANSNREAFIIKIDASQIPEPSSTALLGLGGLALLARRKR